MILGIPVLAYLLAGIGGIPIEANWQHNGFSFGVLAVFLTLEVGVYLLALRLSGWEHLRYPWVMGAVLLVCRQHVKLSGLCSTSFDRFFGC
jgi:hypothetical protein